MDFELPTVVVDNGSGWMKAGFAGEDAPRSAFPSVVGRVLPTVLDTSDSRRWYVGNEAISRRTKLILNYPIERGIVSNFDDMEKLWQYTINAELSTTIEGHPIILTETSLNPKPHREKATQIMFESFNTSAMYLADQAAMVMNASGTTTGVVLESGEGITQVVPVYQGHAIRHAVTRLEIAGRDLTNYMAKLLEERGLTFPTTEGLEIIRNIKETRCQVALDFDQKMQSLVGADGPSYELHDGTLITLGNTSNRCPEALFQPSLLGLESAGIHELVHNAITKCDPNIQQYFYTNIVLAGGNTMLPGLADRLTKELTVLAPSTARVKVVVPPERQYSAWIGASIMSSLSAFQQMWIMKAEYDECGPTIVHRKCF